MSCRVTGLGLEGMFSVPRAAAQLVDLRARGVIEGGSRLHFYWTGRTGWVQWLQKTRRVLSMISQTC